MTAPLASEATQRALEFPSLLRVIAELASTDLGRQAILDLEPAGDPRELDRRRARLVEGERLLLDGALVPQEDEPFAPLLARLQEGRPALDGRDLVRLADLLRSSLASAKRILAASPPCPTLAIAAGALPEARPLLQRIDATLDRRGEVKEDASPLLAQLRREIRRHRDALYKRMQALLSELREELAEDTIPLRNGRLVLLLQAGARGKVKGLLHGRSATGKSFYFEPLDTVDANNALQQAIEDEENERRRILHELYEAVRAERGTLARHADHVTALDAVQASARFAVRAEARLAELSPQPRVLLRGGRHPLLDPRLRELRSLALGQAGHDGEVVPLDVELDEEGRVLVVTGPNAGGKTVALKTTGLLALMHQCGLPVPAAKESRLPFLRRLVATVGDEQDLLADRSTFSGRLLRLKEVWEAAGPESLLLIDELGSGTDPEEGAALSVALLETLVERGALGVITTHLTKLAAAALELPGATCAAMEFESSSGQPTFHLLPGPPGGSEAIALGRRLGLPAEWLERAEAKLGPEQRDLRRMLSEVDRARRELVEARAALAVESADLAKLRERAAAQEKALHEERRGLASRLQAELDDFRRTTQRKLRAEVERLEQARESGKRKNLAGEAAANLFAEAPVFAAPLDPDVEGGALVVGATVRHRALGWRGRLEKLDGDRAEVVVGGKRLRCDIADLVALAPVEIPTAARERAAAAKSAASSARDMDASREPPVEINLIGQRVEPAIETVDAFLDQALLSSHREVRIVHGHGTGRLRDAVRQHLRRHPGVAAERPGEPNEGGNGATVVTLRRE
jgi:DNA mismatch repair protein MutS2